ncbi:hypothetical protein GGR34_001572 [Microvirga flocculans]|uniref:Secreted protein n=1 Tax=Microvirga flocculans TaxID=217168 RepID=A0A7W6IFI4_9HYPH|nr:hypothetical protein [Microvirga flocculans]
MHRRLLTALLLSLAALPAAMARQDPTLVSQPQTATYERDLNRAENAQNSIHDGRQRVGLSRKHERLLSRDPKEIIPDICVGC